MANITKTEATEIAKKLTHDKVEELKNKTVQFQSNAMREYLKTIPEYILKTPKNSKGYLDVRQTFNLLGNGWNHERVVFPEKVPVKNSNYYFEPSSEVADELRKEYNEILKYQKELDMLILEIETALIGLKTYNRIKENFPEAYEFLPKGNSTMLIPNIEKIRKQL